MSVSAGRVLIPCLSALRSSSSSSSSWSICVEVAAISGIDRYVLRTGSRSSWSCSSLQDRPPAASSLLGDVRERRCSGAAPRSVGCSTCWTAGTLLQHFISSLQRQSSRHRPAPPSSTSSSPACTHPHTHCGQCGAAPGETVTVPHLVLIGTDRHRPISISI